MSSVFVLGVTGYIGGSVLVGIKERHPDFIYTALVRSPKDNAAVEAIGVKVVQGSHSDLALIHQLASEHDIIINAADADDLGLTEAILKGMRDRAKAHPSKKPILLHTSGTSVLADRYEGAFIPGVSEKIHDDTDVEELKKIPIDAMHREVDLAIFDCGNSGLINTYIIAPSAIYGKGRGPVRQVSAQIPEMIRVAIKHKQVLQIGPGTNIWNHVHIDDLVQLYGLVFDLALSDTNPESNSYAHWFYGSVGEHEWGAIAKKLAEILKAKGLVETEEVKSVGIDNPAVTPYFRTTAANSRSVGNRGLKLGWKPTGPALLDALEQEVQITVVNK